MCLCFGYVIISFHFISSCCYLEKFRAIEREREKLRLQMTTHKKMKFSLLLSLLLLLKLYLKRISKQIFNI